MSEKIIVGSGAFARELFGLLSSDGRCGNLPTGYLSETRDPVFELETGLKFMGDLRSDGKITGLENADKNLLVCIGNPQFRRRIWQANPYFKFDTYVHPTAVISKNVTIGSGVIVMPFCYLAVNCSIGIGAVLNSYCGIGHDANVGAYTVLSSKVDLTGYVNLGDACFFGSGASCMPKKNICGDSKIGAGVVVTRSYRQPVTLLPPNSTRV